MKILGIYRHYWPDTTPYARLLRGILEDWAAEGHEVEVLTGQPSYNDNSVPRQPWRERLGGVSIRRFHLPPARKRQRLRRGLSLAWFLGRSLASTLVAGRPDLVLVNCNPPIGMGLLVLAAKRLRGIPYVYHCEDIHPEALEIAGHLERGPVYDVLRAIDTKVCNAAAAVVVCSEDMRRTILARGVRSELLVVINNFPLEAYDDARDAGDVDAILGALGGDFVVLFAGNLGNFQGLEALIEAAHLLGDRRDIQFVFMGSGLARDRLEQQAGHLCGNTVHFVGHHSVGVARAVMARSSLGVASLAPGVARVAYPSKLMTYVASGCPVLAIVESDSSIAEDVQRADLGYVCGGRSGAAVARAIEGAYRDRDRWDATARHSLREKGEALFGHATARKKWAALLRLIGARGGDGTLFDGVELQVPGVRA